MALSENYSCTRERLVTSSCGFGRRIFRGLPSRLQGNVASRDRISVSAVRKFRESQNGSFVSAGRKFWETRDRNAVSAAWISWEPEADMLFRQHGNRRIRRGKMMLRHHWTLGVQRRKCCFGNTEIFELRGKRLFRRFRCLRIRRSPLSLRRQGLLGAQGGTIVSAVGKPWVGSRGGCPGLRFGRPDFCSGKSLIRPPAKSFVLVRGGPLRVRFGLLRRVDPSP